jgi:Mg-chelatase subunit ChlD/curli biogenesis system outer membrane secretion channel CsgG
MKNSIVFVCCLGLALCLGFSGCAGLDMTSAADRNTSTADKGKGDNAETKALERTDDVNATKPQTPELEKTPDVSAKRGQSSGLSAGIQDDNKQFNYFTRFLEEYKDAVQAYAIPVQERILIRVTDGDGAGLADAAVSVRGRGAGLASGTTYSDGSFLFFPAEHPGPDAEYEVTAEYAGVKKTASIERRGTRSVDLALAVQRRTVESAPLDIVFILDTTASMGEEINRLKTTIEIIYSNIALFPSKPQVRFGLVLFRDRDDEYVTRVVPLTADLASFQASLDQVEADGGGDTPEDLQAALADALTKIDWSARGVRLGFIITDAPPHLDYGEQYTYVSAVHDARQKGIKLYSIGSGELDLSGEYVLRQISQYTDAKYIFLTYGERGDSEGGKIGSVSHHVGAQYRTDKLEALVIQLAREELAAYTGRPAAPEEDYFQAAATGDEQKTETLQKLFDVAFTQLADYSSLKLAAGTRVSLLPYTPGEASLANTSEYFSEQSVLSLARNGLYKLVERGELQKILKEMELQLSDLADEAKAARVGKLLGAEVLVLGKVYLVKDNYEIFIKLVRVETAEILSVTKVKIDKNLGL